LIARVIPEEGNYYARLFTSPIGDKTLLTIHSRVATAAGILFAISWVLGLATLGTWLIVAFFMRYSSLAALSAAAFAPLYFTFLFGLQPMGLAILVMSLLLIYRHRSNIRNLMNGTETRLAKKGKTS
jgi:glycerol-3-phosphate acyltransferase PlsY